MDILILYLWFALLLAGFIVYISGKDWAALIIAILFGLAWPLIVLGRMWVIFRREKRIGLRRKQS